MKQSLLAEALEVPSHRHDSSAADAPSSSSSSFCEKETESHSTTTKTATTTAPRMPMANNFYTEDEKEEDDSGDHHVLDGDGDDHGIFSVMSPSSQNGQHMQDQCDYDYQSSNTIIRTVGASSFETPKIGNLIQVMNVNAAVAALSPMPIGGGSSHQDIAAENDVDDGHVSIDSTALESGNGSGTMMGAGEEAYLPQHSDFTIPTSNQIKNERMLLKNVVLMQPPTAIGLGQSDTTVRHTNHHHNHKEASNTHPYSTTKNHKKNNGRDGHRSIMGAIVGKRYGKLNSGSNRHQRRQDAVGQQKHPQQHPGNIVENNLLGPYDPITPPESPLLPHNATPPTAASSSSSSNNSIPLFLTDPMHGQQHLTTEGMSLAQNTQQQNQTQKQQEHEFLLHDNNSAYPSGMHQSRQTRHQPQQEQKYPPRSSSRLIPRIVPMALQHSETPPMSNLYGDDGNNDHDHDGGEYGTVTNNRSHDHLHSTLPFINGDTTSNGIHSTLSRNGGPSSTGGASRSPAVHETVHAQSLLLGLAFMAVWTPNNAMAPNLTQMSAFFDMNDVQRDQYLGSYIALAVGVFSLPLSGGIGFMADFYSRKYLFLACVLLGALASAWSGWSKSYWSLFVARLCSGGCMSGSVPVAFSLLGDLFSKEERNAASSGLTAMMGLGILVGQVYAGVIGPKKGWQDPFFFSALLQLVMAAVIGLWVKEPLRGAQEKALQHMLKSGNKYDRQLTLKGFFHAMHRNQSNWIILWQGFLTSLPWGIVFVYLNDYLSQEKGFSVPEATFMVMLFGVGCAIGGITGGYLGQMFMKRNRTYLPLYMAATTFLGIFPFVALLNADFPNHHGTKAKFLSIAGGTICSLPSVNVRPIIINVNPPETRGAALTAANLFVTLGRGLGPLCIVILGSAFQVSRQTSFNVTLAGFWAIAAIQLLFLARTFPRDQDSMEEELARYVAASTSISENKNGTKGHHLQDTPSGSADDMEIETSGLLRRMENPLQDDGESIVSIEDYMTSFDGTAARKSLQFMRLGIKELKDEITHLPMMCNGCEGSVSDDSEEGRARALDAEGAFNDSIVEDDTDMTDEEINRRRELWFRQRQEEHHS